MVGPGTSVERALGVRRLRRPADDRSPAFDLAFVRSGPRGSTPVLVIPGGPGLGSVVPYRGFRRRAAQGGLDVLMVEHRGVGFSRGDLEGADLPVSAMRVIDVVDDLAAVLRHERIDRVVVVGSSYGSYVASAFGARHPELVEAVVLDSALQSAHEEPLERRAVRELFWSSGGLIAQDVQGLVRDGADQRVLLDVLRAAWELCGERTVAALLRSRVHGRHGPVWRALEAYASRDGSLPRLPYAYEFDLAGVIGFRELDYGAPPDGLPLDPALTYAPIADRFPPFAGEDFDLPAATPDFAWPVVVVSGTRDLRTPAATAERVVGTARDGVLVRIENGHSALDTHPAALLNVMRSTVRGRQRGLPARAAELDRLPRLGAAARLADAIRVATGT